MNYLGMGIYSISFKNPFISASKKRKSPEAEIGEHDDSTDFITGNEENEPAIDDPDRSGI